MTRKTKRSNKRPVLQFRIRKPLMTNLQKSAKKSGRSISDEASSRLDESFRMPVLETIIRQTIQESFGPARKKLSRHRARQRYIGRGCLDLDSLAVIVEVDGEPHPFSLRKLLSSAYDEVDRIRDPKMATLSSQRLADLQSLISNVKNKLMEHAKQLQQFDGLGSFTFKIKGANGGPINHTNGEAAVDTVQGYSVHDMPVRAKNGIIGSGIDLDDPHVVDMVAAKSRWELLRTRHFGRRSLSDVEEWLASHGRQLRD